MLFRSEEAVELVRRWNLFQMNLPVLFRTIDGISQITIETQYAVRDLGPSGMARAAVYVSLSSKDKDHALVVWVLVGAWRSSCCSTLMGP